MQVIVHAGMQKTGSSALQEYLHVNRAALGELGIVYPDLGHRSHWLFASALDHSGDNNYLKRRGGTLEKGIGLDGALAAIKDQLTGLGKDGVLILSHESLSTMPQAARLSEFLREAAPSAGIGVIAYTRNPVDHFPSGVQQGIKNKHSRLLNPSKWLSTHPERARTLRRLFGSSLTLRVHTRSFLKDGDIVADFSDYVEQRTGIRLPDQTEQVTTNTSLSASACAILQSFKADDGVEDSDFGPLRGLLFKFDAGRKEPSLKLPAEWKPSIAALNAEGWNEIVGQLAFSEEDKAKLVLSLPDTEPARVRRKDVETWVRSSLKASYLEELTDYCVDNAKAKKGSALRLSEWLKELRASLT